MIIDEWMKEYGIEEGIECEYADLGMDYLGQTVFRNNGGKRTALIRISDRLMSTETTKESVQWHEYCHAEPWIMEGKQEYHGAGWYGRFFRKPFYAIWDLTVAKIIWAVINH